MALPAERSIERVFSESVERELLSYPGKWTGVFSDQIVAVGDSPAEVLRLARSAGYNDVLLHHVPEHDKAYFF